MVNYFMILRPLIIQNTKLKTSRVLFLALSLFISAVVSFETSGQTILNSPLSYIGMGELDEGGSPSNAMMGGLGVSNSNGIYANMINPALLARNRYTVFEVGAKTELKELQDSRQRQQIFGGNYHSLNLTLPITSRWTASIGIRPHSSVEYATRSFRRLNLLGVDSLIYSYDGKGGVTKLSINNGVRIGKEFYLGFGIDYLFGTVNRNVSTQNLSDGQYYKIQLENRIDYSDFLFRGGLAYRKQLKNDLYVNFGTSFDLSSTLSSKQLKRFAIMDLSGITAINADTLNKSTPFTQNLPVTQHFGVSLEKLANWMIGIDYSRTDWTKVDNNLGRSTKLPVSSRWSIGGEYTPDFEAISNYFKRATYRAGFSYSTTPYDYLGNSKYAVDKYFSLGVALPLRNLSFLNIAYQIGKRGVLADNGLEEQYQRITIGLTLSDLWFQKVKLN
ncbi:hypothetical protein G9H62_06970 [Aquirufa ecclesiirivi]|uniref:hypothetical protein n=1 Tax=Aquirufa ecclesiirivi TaxID=2715124 RepID=UPI0022A8179B|nr:hypothetical protein [Aquirufa ecclesiirivi]MCZ2472574.1 hypothetical protein [Aquirufa ecclesiirivi]